MQHVNEAIKKARKNGLIPREITLGESWMAQVLLMPEFWQALGKAEGWKEGVKINGVTQIKGSGWWHHWHDFIDALASGKTPDEFFKEILK